MKQSKFTYQVDVRNRFVNKRLRAHYAPDRERLRQVIDREPRW